MIFLLHEIFQGKSLARALFNSELRAFKAEGRVLDVGGGKHQDYLDIISIQNGASIETVDIVLKEKNGHIVDFEVDALPFDNSVFDQVLVFNVLEHIYNYDFLVSQINRVIKDDGVVLGFVPFLVNYHPDPHDYFRYTKEALRMILSKNGFKDIFVNEVGRGPFAVNYNNIMLSLPKFMRIMIFPIFYFADTVFIFIRPKVQERYPLGYIFTAKK